MSSSIHRAGVRRRVIRTMNSCDPAHAIGPITPGMEVMALHKGQFPLMEIADYLLHQTGPADVTVSTWVAVTSDLDTARALMDHCNLRSYVWVVDRSFPNRQPAYCETMLRRFGPDSIVTTRSHAKFVVIRNANWNLVLRSSMNMSRGAQLESWEISDSNELADYILAVCAEAKHERVEMEVRPVPRRKQYASEPCDQLQFSF